MYPMRLALAASLREQQSLLLAGEVFAPFLTLHRMEQDYPLNLSISLSGGEETNQDAPSNGE